MKMKIQKIVMFIKMKPSTWSHLKHLKISMLEVKNIVKLTVIKRGSIELLHIEYVI